MSSWSEDKEVKKTGLHNNNSFANAIHLKGAALSNCWGFVDGTVRPICRPSQHQEVMYNGHKRIHALKFQTVKTPNDLMAHLYEPVEGRRHNAYIWRESRRLEELEARSQERHILCIYGDPAGPYARNCMLLSSLLILHQSRRHLMHPCPRCALVLNRPSETFLMISSLLTIRSNRKFPSGHVGRCTLCQDFRLMLIHVSTRTIHLF